MRRCFVHVALLGLLTAPLGVSAVPRIAFVVRFELAETVYRQRFEEADFADLERRCADRIASLLADEVKFVDIGTVPQPHTVSVRLGNRDGEPGAGKIRDLNLWISIAGPSVTDTVRVVSWPFRKASDFGRSPGSVTGFVEEVSRAFETQLATDSTALVDSLFSHVVLAHEATAMPDRDSWVLPFSRSDLPVGRESEFVIQAELRDETAVIQHTHRVQANGDLTDSRSLPEGLREKILAEIIGDADRQQLRAAPTMAGKQVYLAKYRRLLGQPLDTRAPTDFDGGN